MEKKSQRTDIFEPNNRQWGSNLLGGALQGVYFGKIGENSKISINILLWDGGKVIYCMNYRNFNNLSLSFLPTNEYSLNKKKNTFQRLQRGKLCDFVDICELLSFSADGKNCTLLCNCHLCKSSKKGFMSCIYYIYIEVSFSFSRI